MGLAASWEHWDVDLIPCPAQWVRDLALPQLQLRRWLKLGSDPWPRSAIFHRVAKNEKNKNHLWSTRDTDYVLCIPFIQLLFTCIQKLDSASMIVLYFISFFSFFGNTRHAEVPGAGCFLFFVFFFLEPHLQHMEVPRWGVELELQLLAYTLAIATWDPSCINNLYYSSRQHQILNPPSEARDWTHILVDTSWVHYHWDTMGMPWGQEQWPAPKAQQRQHLSLLGHQGTPVHCFLNLILCPEHFLYYIDGPICLFFLSSLMLRGL